MIKLYCNGTMTNFKTITFPGGEVHPQIIDKLPGEGTFEFHASIKSSDDLMELVMLSDAVDKFCPSRKKIVLGYIPYSRQDRVCVKGEAFALQAFCKILNSLNFDEVVVVDPHSDVAPALISNVRVISMSELVRILPELEGVLHTTIAVSPDAGANKKVQALSVMAGKSFIRADKVRDCATGSIIGTEVFCDNLKGANVTIWDDICDGGRTFIELAKVLKEKGAGDINLYVTHGIFSKGYSPLFDAGITHIYTTDSLAPEEAPNVTIMEV